MPQSAFKQWEVGESYVVGEVVVYEDTTYRVVQAHKSQGDWVPSTTTSLYSSFKTVEIGGGETVEEWKKPKGSHDAYNIGDKVMYNGRVYESLINANTWSPDDFPAGWKLIES